MPTLNPKKYRSFFFSQKNPAFAIFLLAFRGRSWFGRINLYRREFITWGWTGGVTSPSKPPPPPTAAVTGLCGAVSDPPPRRGGVYKCFVVIVNVEMGRGREEGPRPCNCCRAPPPTAAVSGGRRRVLAVGEDDPRPTGGSVCKSRHPIAVP